MDKKFYHKNRKKRALFFLFTIVSFGLYAQNITVSGTINDSSGVPLAGATVVQVGTTKGTQTDFDGNYSFSVASDGELQFSYIGFTPQTVPVNGQTTIDIVLKEDAQSLDEVVVVGYGTAKKRDITGSVATVDLEDSPIAKSGNTNILQAIRGVVPGVNIGAQNAVGSTPSILIRGTNSLGGDDNNNPLIVLDGAIFTGSVTDINPADIATFNILKDASTAVVYGSRGANGVILITTKRGRTDKPVIKVSTATGFNVWQNKPNLLARDAYLEKFAFQSNVADVEDIVFEDEYRNILQDEGVDTDWIDLISNNGIIERHNISVSGSTDKTNYFFSGGYEQQQGVIIGDRFKRISLRSRLSANITDWLTVGLDGSYTNNDFGGQVADVFLAQRIAPIGLPFRFPGQPFNAAANTSTDLERFPTANNVQNPLWGTDGTRTNTDTRDFFRLAINTKLSVPWVKGLSYTLNYASDIQFLRQDIFESEAYHITLPIAQPFFDRYSDAALQGNLVQANGSNLRRRTFNYAVSNIVNYNNTFGKSNIDLTVGATRDLRDIDETVLTGSDFSNVGNTALGASGLAFANVVENSRDAIKQTNIGYIGRVSYGYDQKYNLNAAIRRDGSSVFGDDAKFGTFYSVGGAWTVTEEDFIPKSDFLNYLKINASYGTNGNQGLSAFGTLSSIANGLPGNIRVAFGDDPSNSQFGIDQTSLGNTELGFEETTAVNIGVHASLLKNKIALDVDYYSSKTEDQIFNRFIPTTTGFNSILASLGRVDNSGVEITLKTTNISTKDVNWTSGLIFTRNRNEIVSVFGDDNDGDGVEDDDLANSLFIGESIGTIFGFEFIGVVQESDTQYIEDNGAVPGDPMFRDLDGIPGITADGDRKILGTNRANFSMSLSNTFRYKNFSLYTLLSGTFGGNGFYQGQNPRAISYQNRFDFNDVENGPFFTLDNPSTTNLRPDFNDNRFIGLQSRSFVRMQNVNLTYQFTPNVLKGLNLGLSALEVYASGDNVFVITDWFGGGDPERGFAAQSGNLPVPSTYLLGVNLTF